MKNDEIKLLRGDCLELAEQIPDGSIDMVLCDPPYGVTDCRWDSVLPFDAMWRMYERVVKANGAIALFSSQPFTTRLIHSNICQYRYTWYWIKNIKTGHVFAKVQPMRQVEEVCIFYRKKPLYQPQGLVKLEREIIHRKQAQADAVYRLDKRANASVQRYGNYPSNVLRFDVDSGEDPSASQPEACGAAGILHPHIHQAGRDGVGQLHGLWFHGRRLRAYRTALHRDGAG